MTLPANLTTGTVTGTLLDTATGAPLKGSVTFTPDAQLLLNRGGATTHAAITQTVLLGKDGGFSVALIATDNADILPTGWTWRIEFHTNQPIAGFSFPLSSGVSVDIATLVPAPGSRGEFMLDAISDSLVASAINGPGTQSESQVIAKIDARLGGNSTNLVPTVAGKADKGSLVVNVKDYGATGDGTTDDTAAILAAQTAAGFRPLFFPNGTYKCSATITAQTILGANRQKTILSYTGTGAAVGVPDAGVQTYHRRIQSLTIRGTGTGTGLDLNCVSSGLFQNLLVDQFTQCVWLRASSGAPQQCLYNTFIDVTAQNASGYAWRLQDVANENRFIGCRVNIATRGFQIDNGGHNLIEGCAIENCSERGVSIPDTTPGQNLTRGNVIAHTRFEFNANNVTISTGVQMTMVLANRFVGGTYTDNGTGTVLVHQESGSIAAGRYATGARPTAPVAGAMVYDTTLGKPIWWNGTSWRDAAGVAV